MENTTEILPYPFDASRRFRDANRARVGLIYQAALNQAERRAQQNSGADGTQPLKWPLSPDTLMVSVQPVQPSSPLLRLNELNDRTRALQNGPVGNFFTGLATPIPFGLLWSDFYLSEDGDGDDRSARIALDNGLVCHVGQALSKVKADLPRLYLSHLMNCIILTVQVAHQLHREHIPEAGMALSIAVENLGKHTVFGFMGMPVGRSAVALIETWVWPYYIPAATFSDEAQLNEWILTTVEEVCWGLGSFQINRQLLMDAAKQQGLKLTL